LLQRPRDISFLLDELQRRATTDPRLARIDVRRVGAIGHSLGGYTTLALAGAQIDFDRIAQSCNPNRSLNVSFLLQCRAKELPARNYALRDPRIAAIFTINPLGNAIFGQRGIGQINVPTFVMGGSDDVVTPVVPEQIYPFTWVRSSNKYLAILDKGTHFSAPAENTRDPIFPVVDNLIDPDPRLAQTYVKALNVAFFQTYLNNRPEFS
jgi:predicted dienelactone hydrolase